MGVVVGLFKVFIAGVALLQGAPGSGSQAWSSLFAGCGSVRKMYLYGI